MSASFARPFDRTTVPVRHSRESGNPVRRRSPVQIRPEGGPAGAGRVPKAQDV